MDEDFRIPDWMYSVASGLAALFCAIAIAGWYWSDSAPHDAPAIAAPVFGKPQLLVFESASCGWCVRFRQDVAPAYDVSRFNSLAPLRYIDIKDQRSSGYRLNGRIGATPTFVLVDPFGKEVARLRGYPGGPSRFMPEVELMLAKLASRD